MMSAKNGKTFCLAISFSYKYEAFGRKPCALNVKITFLIKRIILYEEYWSNVISLGLSLATMNSREISQNN